MKIIGIAGKKHSGKSTVSKFFVDNHKFTEIALADPLKKMLSDLFSIDIKYFYDEKLKDGQLPDRVVIDYSHLDKLRQIVKDWGFQIGEDEKQAIQFREAIEEYNGDEVRTARELMQIFGTDILRTFVRDDIWIVLLFSRMKELSGNIVVSDVRLKNEREALKAAGAQLMLIKRPAVNSTDNHSSEHDFGKDSEYNVVINNDDISLANLKSEVMMWYSIKMEYK